MKFFCPGCNASIAGDGQTQQVTCQACGLEVDLGLATTDPGGPRLPLLADRSGDRLGPYRLDEGLGSGGMGTVYRATDTRDDRRVALKLLSPQLAAFPAIRARFEREAKALAELSHPRVVEYIDAGQQDGDHYLVMEYLEGQDLGSYLAEKPIWPAEAERIAGQICQALDAAHAKGIIHRDLKPANIFVTDDGVRVLDFGIAQLASDDVTLTHTDAMLGTFNYMSPEQRARAGGVDHRSDLYSLGVMLYRMYTGQLPMGAFEPPSKLNPHLTARHDRLVMGLLSADPDRRPPSAAALLAEIGDLSARPRVRGRLMGLAAGLLVVGLAVGGGIWFWGPAPESDQAQPQPAPVDKTAAQALAKVAAEAKQDPKEAPPEATKEDPKEDPKEASREDPKSAHTTALSTKAAPISPASTRAKKAFDERLSPKSPPKVRRQPKGRRSKAPAKTKSPKATPKKRWAAKGAEPKGKKRRPKLRYQFVLSPKTLLHAAATPKSEASLVEPDLRVRRLSKTKGGDGRLWARVETEDGRIGFVPAKALRMSK